MHYWKWFRSHGFGKIQPGLEAVTRIISDLVPGTVPGFDFEGGEGAIG